MSIIEIVLAILITIVTIVGMAWHLYHKGSTQIIQAWDDGWKSLMEELEN